MRKGDLVRGGEGDGLEGAGLTAAVAGVAAPVTDGDLRPGKALELVEQGGLVAFDLDGQVAASDRDLVGVAGLGVQGVSDEQDTGQAAQHGLDGIQQWREGGDLVALGVDGDLGQDDAGAGVQRGQQVDLTTVCAARGAQGLAVDGDHLAVPSRPRRRGPGAGAEPAGQDGGQKVGVQAGQQPPHRRAYRHSTGESQAGLGLGVQIVQPVGDRGER